MTLVIHGVDATTGVAVEPTLFVGHSAGPPCGANPAAASTSSHRPAGLRDHESAFPGHRRPHSGHRQRDAHRDVA